MKILIDNGHGIQTKGKRSPDGKLLEYAYTRNLARQIVKILKTRGYDSELLIPEDDDIPLSERVRRANEICLTYEPSCPAPTGHPDVILISLHLNAAGDGTKWMNATGWSCYTCKGQTESDRLADCLYKAAANSREPGNPHRLRPRRRPRLGRKLLYLATLALPCSPNRELFHGLTL